MSQTSYSVQAVRGKPGLLADPAADAYLQSRAPEGGPLSFGVGVQYGTDPENQVVEFAGGVFAGVMVRTHALGIESERRGELTPGDFSASVGETSSILRKGRVWVQTNEVVAPGDAVFVVNTGADAGKFRNDATSATAVAGAAFESYDADTGLAILELNQP